MNSYLFKKYKVFGFVIYALFFMFGLSSAHAAGSLTAVGSTDQPIKLKDHHVNISIHGSFATTEVFQTFYNPNSKDLEAIYSMPVPKSGSLSEFTIYEGETKINGEVIPRNKANEIYEEEKQNGNQAGVANKNSYQNYEFKVARVIAQAETKIRFVYYQPLEIDTGLGKYLYPLEEGGTDDIGASFWLQNDKVEGTFSANIDIRAGYPIKSVRVPGFENAATITEIAEGHTQIELTKVDATLGADLVVYYALAENLPGRVDMIAYRPEANKPGTFLLTVTPGLDLQPIKSGADYTFVLDVSGSMQGKIHTLVSGVKRSIKDMNNQDRFRIISFSDNAQEITSGWVTATEANLQKELNRIDSLRAGGSTNLYDGMKLALDDLDDDRVNSVILVTDAVTNTGIVDPKEFETLMKQVDVRVFGFLLGNSSNWPLMKVICNSTGGFFSTVSNADDILGQIMLAKGKILFESLHDASLKIRGIKAFDTTDEMRGKIYRGQQLLITGRYEEAGVGEIILDATLSGADKTYKTKVNFPEIATEFPELERIWAFERIEEIEYMQDLGQISSAEGSKAIEDLGVAYQLVTDETSMLVLSDEAFDRHGIARNNQKRIAIERAAKVQRASRPANNYRVDRSQSMFGKNSPSVFSGGGAIDPLTAAALLAFGAAGLGRRKRNFVDKE